MAVLEKIKFTLKPVEKLEKTAYDTGVQQDYGSAVADVVKKAQLEFSKQYKQKSGE